MKKIIIFLFFASVIHAQNESPWKRVNPVQLAGLARNNARPNTEKQLFFQLDEITFRKSLVVGGAKTSRKEPTQIMIPNINGIMEKFLVWESSNFEPELQVKYTDIKAYAGVGITDTKASLNFSVSPSGIQTMVLRAGNESEFIEASNDKKAYVLFNSKGRETGSLPFACKTEDVAINKQLLNSTGRTTSNKKIFKTFRLALSCTGEYTVYHGGTVANALAAMNATMTRVNGIFGRDLAVKLNIISNDNLIIYTNAATDPYTDAIISTDNWNVELQNTLTSVIGDGNYDIGHLFGASGGGGNAGCIGCVCDVDKGSGYTSPADGKPEGDNFDIDFVAHEMGHQLGATHTYSEIVEGNGVNVEPGSGSTIMGYAGITDHDIQSHSDDYFAYVSMDQIQSNLSTKFCGSSDPIANNPPVISAGLDYTIPKGTAFVLKGNGSDVNGDSITYCWEQNDDAVNNSGDSSIAFATKTDGPLFRSLKPMSTAIRYMPALNAVLLGKLSSTWESVSNIARTLHFTLTGRDNAAPGTAQTNTDAMIVNVSETTGPFAVTSQNTKDLSWIQRTSQIVTWDVKGSNTLPGSSKVNIKLSTDGGLTFPTVLLANTPNDGSEAIKVPIVAATNCRLLIEPVDNIYYAINSEPFAIGYTSSSSCETYTFAAPFAIPESATYATRTISVPATTGVITDVNLSIGLKHALVSDVQMEVVNPQGTTVKLFDRSCGDTINSSLLLNYDDLGGVLSCGSVVTQTVAPIDPLAVFNGNNPQGVWTLRVRDNWIDDVGTIESASITICKKNFSLIPPILETNDFIVYSNPNKGIFNIQFVSNFTSETQVFVHDLMGKKVYEKHFADSDLFNEVIELINVQPGVYLVTVIDGVRVGVKKIIVE